MRVTYEAVPQTLTLEEEGITYQTYGILGREGTDERLISDVALQEEEAMAWAEQLTAGEASLLHFPEIIEDFLAR